MKKKDIIREVYEHFDEIGFCTYTDDEFEIVWIHHGLSFVIIEDDIFNISFEVNCDPTVSAIITQELIELSYEYDMEVDIYETYADVVNEEGVVQEVLFGEDALYYHETGEIPEKEIKLDKKEEDGIDMQKKVDTILDQINKSGMKSLNREQKKTLNDFSKGKNEHKH